MTERKRKKRTQTLIFRNRPYVVSSYSLGGKKEGKGPLAGWFDCCLSDYTFGEKTW